MIQRDNLVIFMMIIWEMAMPAFPEIVTRMNLNFYMIVQLIWRDERSAVQVLLATNQQA